MDHLVLHIGTHKTGSSAIQSAFTQHALPTDYLYPKTGRIASGGHLNLAWEAIGDQRHRPERGNTKDLVNELSESDARVVVLSAETFSVPSAGPAVVNWVDDLVEIFEPACLLIVGYVRPQWEYLESHYTQMVKTGITAATLEEFVLKEQDRPLFNYPVLFSVWDERFGDSLQVRPYVPDVVSDFFGLLGLDPPRIDGVNARPGAKQLEMLRTLRDDLDNLDDPIARDRRSAVFRWALDSLTKRYPDDRPYRGITVGLAHRLEERFRDSNQRLADLYWGGELPLSFRRPEQVRTSVWTFQDATESDEKYYTWLRDQALTRSVSVG